MDAQLKKGLLDACVLATVAKDDTYGYKLIEDLRPIIEISESTLYPILKRLEQNEYLETYSKEHSGRLRKYYVITEYGRSRLKDYKIDWLEMKSIYGTIFKEEL